MSFSSDLIQWYHASHRSLPWRETRNPYYIWISEVVLQQTQVVQALDYYEMLITHFPTVQHMAEASEEDLLHIWQGLGYYSRARNMHATAKNLMQRFNGHFPSDYHALLSLKGIGPYTAAAISSFAFELPYPVIDGNVLRVMSRYAGITEPVDSRVGRKQVEETLHALFDSEQPSAFNQAIMELGALICKPSSPLCHQCPVRQGCYAWAHQRTSQLPVKRPKKATRNRFLHYLLIDHKNHYLLRKRTENDIWRNLHEFPLIELPFAIEDEQAILEYLPFKSDNITRPPSFIKALKHQLSHQSLYVRFYQQSISFSDPPAPFFWVHESALKDYSMPVILRRFADALIG